MTMDFLKRQRWLLIGLVLVGLVVWLRFFYLGQASRMDWLFPLFIAWLCTPRQEYRTGTWLSWFAIWWLAVGLLRSSDPMDLWQQAGLFGVLLVVTSLRIWKVIMLDAKASLKASKAEGKLE